MTEDMRERFEKAREDFAAAYNDIHSRCVARAAFMAGWQEAALSSAGTSGTPDRCPLCESQVREIRLCLICDTSHKTELYSNRQCIAAGKPNFCSDPWHRGDSLFGKGEATPKCPTCGSKERDARHALATDSPNIDLCPDKWHTASAPDRAEELARALDDEAERIVSNCACATQLDELRDEEHDTYRTMVLNVRSGLQRVASLLRREMAAAPPREEG